MESSFPGSFEERCEETEKWEDDFLERWVDVELLEDLLSESLSLLEDSEESDLIDWVSKSEPYFGSFLGTGGGGEGEEL